MVPKLNWWIQGITFSTDMHVLDFGAYDVVLGMDWPQPFNPMNCHWLNKTLSFDYKGKHICIQGAQAKRQASLPELSSEQLHKWCMSNKILLVAVLELQSQYTQEQTTAMPIVVQSLLQQYTDIFTKPKSLPPHR